MQNLIKTASIFVSPKAANHRFRYVMCKNEHLFSTDGFALIVIPGVLMTDGFYYPTGGKVLDMGGVILPDTPETESLRSGGIRPNDFKLDNQYCEFYRYLSGLYKKSHVDKLLIMGVNSFGTNNGNLTYNHSLPSGLRVAGFVKDWGRIS